MNKKLLAALLVAIIVFALNASYYHGFYFDDSYISLRYAERFLDGKGLTWNDGEKVEGYSNLLWILLTSLLGTCGVDLVLATRILGVVSAAATGAALVFYARPMQLSVMALGAGLAALAAAPPVAIWALGGLEADLVMALLAWAVVLVCVDIRRYRIAIGTLLGLICLTRPEGPVYTACIAAAYFLQCGLPLRKRVDMLVPVCGIAAAFFTCQLAFRLGYYDQWIANSAMAKVAWSPARLRAGLYYVMGALYSFVPVLLYIFIYHRGMRQENTPLQRSAFRLVALIAAFISCAIFLGGGGDFYEGGFRLFVPVIPLILILMMHAVEVPARQGMLRRESIFLFYMFCCYVWLQNAVDGNAYARYRHGEIYAQDIGELLAQRYGAAQPLVGVAAAGAVPYFSKLPSLDVLGINDAYLTQHRYERKQFGKGNVGHELFDAEYIKFRKPDILVLAMPMMGNICEYNDCGDLLSDYKPETVKIRDKPVTIWLRKGSEKLK